MVQCIYPETVLSFCANLLANITLFTEIPDVPASLAWCRCMGGLMVVLLHTGSHTPCQKAKISNNRCWETERSYTVTSRLSKCKQFFHLEKWMNRVHYVLLLWTSLSGTKCSASFVVCVSGNVKGDESNDFSFFSFFESVYVPFPWSALVIGQVSLWLIYIYIFL